MASEAKRLAALLVADRPASFESAYGRAISEDRLRAAIADGKIGGEVRAEGVRLVAPGSTHRCAFEGRWKEEGGVVLEGQFVPAPRNRRMLMATSILLSILVAASAWALATDEVKLATRILVPLSTAFAILAVPYAIIAMGSRREAEETVVGRVVRDRLSPSTR